MFDDLSGSAILDALRSRELWLWVAAIAMIAVGLIGTILPALPGVLLMYAGMWLAAWIDGFARIGWQTLTILGVLTALTFLTDLIATLLGARRVGASRQALLGSVLGGIGGLFFGIPGLILGPFIGAVAGELFARRTMSQATRVGVGTWLGIVFGTLAKLALAITMIGVFLAGLLL